MNLPGLTTLNEQLNTYARSNTYNIGHAGSDPYTSILIYIKAIQFLIEELSDIQFIMNNISSSGELGDVRIVAHQKVELCIKVLKEFKIGFIAPEDYQYAKEMKSYFNRFLYIEEKVNLYYATFNLKYLGCAIEQLHVIMSSFKRVKDIINNQTFNVSENSKVVATDRLKPKVIPVDKVFTSMSL